MLCVRLFPWFRCLSNGAQGRRGLFRYAFLLNVRDFACQGLVALVFTTEVVGVPFAAKAFLESFAELSADTYP